MTTFLATLIRDFSFPERIMVPGIKPIVVQNLGPVDNETGHDVLNYIN